MSAEAQQRDTRQPAEAKQRGEHLLEWLDQVSPAAFGASTPLWCVQSLTALLQARTGAAVAPEQLGQWLLGAGVLSNDGGLPADPEERVRASEWSRQQFAPLAQQLGSQGRAIWWLQEGSQADGRWTLVGSSALGQLVLVRCCAAELPATRSVLLAVLAGVGEGGALVGVCAGHPRWLEALQQLPDPVRQRLLVAAPGHMPRADATQPAEPAPAPTPATERSLFRAEAQARQGDRLEGEVLLARPLSQRVLTAGAALIVVALVVFACVGRFSKTETAPGVLAPSSGVTRVMVAQTGVVRDLRVKVGDMVQAGQPLLTVANSRVSGDGAVVDQQIINELQRTLASVEEEQANQIGQAALEHDRLRRAALSARRLVGDAERQRKLQSERVALLADKLERMRPLFASGVIAAVQFRELEAEQLSAELQLVGAERELEAASARASEAEATLAEQPSRQRSRQAELVQRGSELRQRLAEAELRSGSQIQAPSSGRVAAVLVDPGGRVGPDRPAVLLVDDSQPLVAELWVPTRGAGFLRAGQEVRLKLAAYPYQRFGYQLGRIIEVSETSLDPGEAVGPIRLPEASYAVRVELDRQSLLAFGEDRPLQAGMLLDADILIDRPRIVDWVLEPLYSLKGRS
jgi:membrane fusion protein